jgi:hypothetical protein
VEILLVQQASYKWAREELSGSASSRLTNLPGIRPGPHVGASERKPSGFTVSSSCRKAV